MQQTLNPWITRPAVEAGNLRPGGTHPAGGRNQCPAAGHGRTGRR